MSFQEYCQRNNYNSTSGLFPIYLQDLLRETKEDLAEYKEQYRAFLNQKNIAKILVLIDQPEFIERYIDDLKLYEQQLAVNIPDLEYLLQTDRDLIAEIKEDLELESLLDSRKKVRPDVLKYTQTLYRFPTFGYHAAREVLEEIDEEGETRGYLYEYGLPLIQTFIEENKEEKEIASRIYFSLLSRRIIENYLRLNLKSN